VRVNGYAGLQSFYHVAAEEAGTVLELAVGGQMVSVTVPSL
jgi:hypothetical protein